VTFRIPIMYVLAEKSREKLFHASCTRLPFPE
jgi:hypothetical protein